ncbi:hypothetical protein FB45DRAFT_898580 [Roridomyces roridus]|uniref:Uncharacterized protein n=1 Tax=Roridomyces roridus TaxID=1738132 RepID=A0AAD7FV56_9AGAR|nr:hypothetical protein FB45DRAFT_898580 [Roridomyces roridus]
MNETMALGPVFPHVHTLRTKFDPAILSRNRLAWDKFPGVHSLSLWCWESDTLPLDQAAHRVVPPDVMSLLEEYTGCPQALPLFAARATLRRVDIPQSCLRTLMPSLNWGQSPQITSFSAGLDIMDVTNLSLIFDTFPMLQVISIVVINNDDDDDGGEGGCPDSTGARFFSTVAEAPTLPSTLQYLTLIWESEYRYVNPPESIDGLADIPAMRKKLRERCPALRKVWLEGIHFVSTWRRSDSEEEGEEKTTVGTIGSKGDGHEDFWEGN